MIQKPLVTEKTLREAANNRYTFLVDKKETKTSIAHQISQIYGVTVTGIQTTVIPARSRRIGVSLKKTTIPAKKKATVSLKKGQKIDIYDVPKEEPIKTQDKQDKKEEAK